MGFPRKTRLYYGASYNHREMARLMLERNVDWLEEYDRTLHLN